MKMVIYREKHFGKKYLREIKVAQLWVVEGTAQARGE